MCWKSRAACFGSLDIHQPCRSDRQPLARPPSAPPSPHPSIAPRNAPPQIMLVIFVATLTMLSYIATTVADCRSVGVADADIEAAYAPTVDPAQGDLNRRMAALVRAGGSGLDGRRRRGEARGRCGEGRALSREREHDDGLKHGMEG